MHTPDELREAADEALMRVIDGIRTGATKVTSHDVAPVIRSLHQVMRVEGGHPDTTVLHALDLGAAANQVQLWREQIERNNALEVPHVPTKVVRLDRSPSAELEDDGWERTVG